MTSDGKYWIVEIYTSVYHNEFSIVTVDSKTWKSKIDNGEWRSLDELKASHIAEFQSEGSLGEPQKTTINNKEIWKILVHYEYSQENGWSGKDEYVYVDLATGKSKNTWNEFNNASGTDGWLKLKEVDNNLNKIHEEMDRELGVPTTHAPFRNALRNLYPE